MKSISVTDLQLIPELSHLRMFDFIHPDNSEKIAPFLKEMGFDLDYPVVFEASQHRNLQGKVVIAYTIYGEIECNDSFRKGAWCSLEDRAILAGYQDLSHAEEMGKLQSRVPNYYTGGADKIDDATGLLWLPANQLNEDEQGILDQIKILEQVLLEVRGNPFKRDGSRKLLTEGDEPELPVPKGRRRRKNKE